MPHCHDHRVIHALLRLRDRGGRDADKASAQLARLSMASGRIENGQALYRDLLSKSSVGGTLRQSIAWNYGWDLYRTGDAEGALRQWSDALSARLTKPAWAPPTFALALWSDPARLPSLLPDWTQADRDALAEVLAAWAADPPAWP